MKTLGAEMERLVHINLGRNRLCSTCFVEGARLPRLIGLALDEKDIEDIWHLALATAPRLGILSPRKNKIAAIKSGVLDGLEDPLSLNIYGNEGCTFEGGWPPLRPLGHLEIDLGVSASSKD